MSRTYVSSVVALVLVSVFSVMVLSVVVPGESAADAPNPIAVYGTVYDNAGNKVEGIPVAVNMKDGDTVVTTKTDTSDGDGVYSVLFMPSEWEIGYTIQVIGTGPSGEAVNSTVAPATGPVYIDLHFSYAIPEFGFDAGVLLAGGAVGLIAVAVMVRKPK